MRRIVLLPCFLVFLSIASLAQNSYTVSNVPGTSANFRTLQGAHDSVAAGSILYLLPSSTSYGDAAFTKKLTVYGTGYFIGANLSPNTQASTGGVIVNSINFRPGSDNSFIEGLQLTDITGQSPVVRRIYLDTVSNVVISRCLFTPFNGGTNYYFYLSGANNCIIRNCYVYSQGRLVSSFINMYQATGYSGIQFRNNIIDYSSIGDNGFFMQSNLGQGISTDALFINNTFLVNLRNYDFANLSYTNNIFVNTAGPGTFYNYNNGLYGNNLNNITNAPLLWPTVGNNQLNANTDSLFVKTLSGYHSMDQGLMLRDTSYANTYGVGGIACGAYGGETPYKLSGIPAIPYIYSLSVPTQATAPGTITVRIKAHASN